MKSEITQSRSSENGVARQWTPRAASGWPFLAKNRCPEHPRVRRSSRHTVRRLISALVTAVVAVALVPLNDPTNGNAEIVALVNHDIDRDGANSVDSGIPGQIRDVFGRLVHGRQSIAKAQSTDLDSIETLINESTGVDESHQGDSTSIVTVDGVDMVVHSFTTPGSALFVVPLAVTAIDTLIVGGGGGGGARYGGGGAGGGVVTQVSREVIGGQSLSIVVGAGGNGGVTGVSGSDGAASSIGDIQAFGGGGGGNRGNGRNGASGGGGGASPDISAGTNGGTGIVGQGFAGGRGNFGPYINFNTYPNLAAGGGGGAGSAGGNAVLRQAGNGGIGFASSITGTSITYGGGGGGGAFTGASPNFAGTGNDGGGNGTATNTAAENGVDGRGGGGGGGGLTGVGEVGGSGGKGGDGIVVVRYPVSTTTAAVSVSSNQVPFAETLTVAVNVEPSDVTGLVTMYASVRGDEVTSSTLITLGTCLMTRVEPGSCELETDELEIGEYEMFAEYEGSAAYTSSTTSSVNVEITPNPNDTVLSGFFSPIDMNGVVNTVKGGSTVPLKFKLTQYGQLLTDTANIDRFSVGTVACGSLANGSTLLTDDIEFTTTGNTSLRYDEKSEHFVQNWKVPNTKGRCYRVTVSLVGTTTEISAYVMTNP